MPQPRHTPPLSPLHQLSLLPEPARPPLSPAVCRAEVVATLADLLVEALGERPSDPSDPRGGDDEPEDRA